MKELRTSALSKPVSVSVPSSLHISHPMPDLRFLFYVTPEMFRILLDRARNIRLYNCTALRHALLA